MLFVSCKEEKVSFNYDKELITHHIADLLIKESAAEFYAFEIRDSIAKQMENQLINSQQLDSMKMKEDLDLISSDIEYTKEYFGRAREILKAMRDSMEINGKKKMERSVESSI